MARIHLMCLAFAIAACGGAPAVEATTTTSEVDTSSDPVVALRQALDEIESGGGPLVIDDRQIVLLAGAEGATTDEIAGLFSSIGAGRVRANFWQGFSAGIATDDIELTDVRFGEVAEFSDDGMRRVSIEVWQPGRAGMRVWHLAEIDEEWRLDLFATFGDVYAGPLRLLLRSLDPGSDGFPDVIGALAAQAASLDLAPVTDARLAISADLAELP